MMRSLWTAASGMTSQQLNVDTISNNLANVNTTGYKREGVEFKSLLYQTIQEQSFNNNGQVKPAGIQVGLGVRSSAITSQYTNGSLLESNSDYHFAVEGEGFFMIGMPDGSTAYTRDGAFQMAIGVEGLTLATKDGHPVLDATGQPIVFDSTYDVSKISVDELGNLSYPDETNNEAPIGKTLGLAQFSNPSGLTKMSGSLLKETDASGQAKLEAMDGSLVRSKVHQGYLEGSNVQVVEEMVNLITAQRAYELSSKIITASDEMLQQANNLR